MVVPVAERLKPAARQVEKLRLLYRQQTDSVYRAKTDTHSVKPPLLCDAHFGSETDTVLLPIKLKQNNGC